MSGSRQGTIEAPIEMVESEPNSRLTIKSRSKGFDVRAAQTFCSVGDGATEVTEDPEVWLRASFGCSSRLSPVRAPKQAGEVHRRFKEILEKSA
jgi:hypothetical protein